MSNPAETYESYMVPTLFSPWALRLIQMARLQPGEHILDVGCGTGIVARQAAALVGASGKVAGLDLNPHMLSVARSAAGQEGVSIEWHEGRAEQLPFPNGSFDVVLCQFALMFFSDRRAAITEMYRVVRNGGRVCLSVFQSIDRHPFYQRLDDVIQQQLGMSGVKEIFALGDAGVLHKLMLDAGFSRVDIEPVTMTARFPNPEGFLAGEIDVDTAAIPSMQQFNTRERQAITAAIHDDMKKALQEVTQEGQVVIPFHVHMVRADC